MENFATCIASSINLPDAIDTLDDAGRESVLLNICEALADAGWVKVTQMFSPAFIARLNEEYLTHWEHFLAPAGIGRGGAHQQDASVRRDKITWLEPDTPAVREFLSHMEALRTLVNRHLYLGLFEYEAHFARYQPGDFYRTHRDAFAGQSQRKLSTVLYLNQSWNCDDGGELIMYNDAGQELQAVLPQGGNMVIFLSEEFPHEVKPATRTRDSIAGWFRINQGIL